MIGNGLVHERTCQAGFDFKLATVQESDLKRLHEGAIKNDPFISQALGPNAKIERMKAASLRLGGQGLRTTFDDHLVIIGDAAGHIDPLTGEGIHTAIMVSVPHDKQQDTCNCSLVQQL